MNTIQMQPHKRKVAIGLIDSSIIQGGYKLIQVYTLPELF